MSGGHLHATGLAIAGSGVLIRGRTGSGKSSLALSVLRRAEALGLAAALVADDQVLVEVRDGTAWMRTPRTIAGLIEVRGIGILRTPFAEEAPLRLVVDLAPRAAIERLPSPAAAEIAGVAVRRVTLAERDPAFGADLLLTLFGRNGTLDGLDAL